ncbi:hypothetical protein EVAR_42804_1 [Eumeta japonica]|uniref:Uncharacterized protein n=1 Tax=Eumeta variegata TaxID=151549 RepID=A0A4C1WGB7_EUMVA|nr:hypothetical protein EVAR_42804_1 [Eumeta japonica]
MGPHKKHQLSNKIRIIKISSPRRKFGENASGAKAAQIIAKLWLCVFVFQVVDDVLPLLGVNLRNSNERTERFNVRFRAACVRSSRTSLDLRLLGRCRRAQITQISKGSVPRTRFTCQGRASGYYADVDTGCQVSGPPSALASHRDASSTC